MIQLGVCTSALHAPVLADAGFDYVEENFVRVTENTPEAHKALIAAVRESGIPALAYNGFLPKTPTLFGADADLRLTREHIRRGLDRIAELGGKTVVFGSGAARHAPDGMPIEEAYDRFAEVCRMAAELAAPYGVRIAIEPLRASESNYLNYVSEAFDVVRRAGFPPALGAHADLYHMAAGRDEIGNLLSVSLRLYHCHIAEPETRQVCRRGEHDAYYASFFKTLKLIGYTGGVSFEGGGFKPDGARALYDCLNHFRA